MQQGNLQNASEDAMTAPVSDAGLANPAPLSGRVGEGCNVVSLAAYRVGKEHFPTEAGASRKLDLTVIVGSSLALWCIIAICAMAIWGVPDLLAASV